MPRTRCGPALLAVAVLLTVAMSATPSAQAVTAAGLPRLNVTGNYVAGNSAGGSMATQLQVADSSRFRGAAIFGAGPYWCAMGRVAVTLQSCTEYLVPSDMQALYDTTSRYASQGTIDPLRNLTTSRTYVFRGTLDPAVAQPVADNLATYYRHYGVPLTYRSRIAAGHGWISALGPVPCPQTGAPYLNNCWPYDAQADSLRVMFGSVSPRNTGVPRGRLTSFDQNRYAVAPAPGVGDVARSGATAIGMGPTGYLYTPDSCATGARCALVVALHGCLQAAEQIGTTFARLSGLNQYADTNHFVVLYPQARPDATFINPAGCWDWWGYLGPRDADYATKLGPQVRTVMNMVSALGG